MNDAEAHLLSPYRPPTSYPVTLGAEEAAAWLTGWFALWHPAVLERLRRPPVASSSYDHDQPGEGFVYAVPAGPHLYQPDDWTYRLQQANAVSFQSELNRTDTAEAMSEAFRLRGLDSPLLALTPEITTPFAAVGYGHLIVESLFDAADHEHLLDAEGFWADVQSAVQAARDGADAVPHLRAAAEKLRSARETLCSNGFSFADWVMLPADANESFRWPESLHRNLPLTVIAPAEHWEYLRKTAPECFAEIVAKLPPGLPGTVDLAVGGFAERDDSFLPIESQCWNLTRGRGAIRAWLGNGANLLYGRKRSALHPSLPTWLKHCGFERAIVTPFDGALTPTRNQSVVNWPAPDGKSIDATAKEAQPADDALTFFNIIHTLHQATSTDSYPLVPLLHRGEEPAVGYSELSALADLAPAVGEFVGTHRYLEEHNYGDYLGSTTADDYFSDALDDRTTTRKRSDPVSGFAKHLRLRRRLDTAFTLTALHRMLTAPTPADLALQEALSTYETAIETAGADGPGEPEGLAASEAHAVERLAARLQGSAAANVPGYLIFNPCAYTRRAALEIADFGGQIPMTDPVKAAQFDGKSAKLVVEIPSLGFAWIPSGRPGTPAAKPKLKTAEGTIVRNEFFEAEVDPTTGGLRAFRDMRTRLNRLGMVPIWNPGSTCKATGVTITSSGAALGEITSTGDIHDDQGVLLATFTQRLRAWMGRPALEVLVTFDVKQQAVGYPWHGYFGTRFGRRDERAVLFRGSHGKNARTSGNRPCSADYLEFRLGGERTFVFTGGLPFLQTQSNRLVDAVLIPEGETERRFEFLIAADRDHPMQTAQGWTTPTPVLKVNSGPPNGLTSSWLGHLDLPSLLLTTLRPDEGRAITARFVETASYAGSAELRFAVPPATAATIDGLGAEVQAIVLNGGALPLEFSADEGFRLRAAW